MDITLYEFNALNDFDKGEALWEYGVHLSERFDDLCGYLLYQINDFYVEVTYNVDANQISKFTSFKTETKLQPYLNKIDISDLLI